MHARAELEEQRWAEAARRAEESVEAAGEAWRTEYEVELQKLRAQLRLSEAKLASEAKVRRKAKAKEHLLTEELAEHQGRSSQLQEELLEAEALRCQHELERAEWEAERQQLEEALEDYRLAEAEVKLEGAELYEEDAAPQEDLQSEVEDFIRRSTLDTKAADALRSEAPHIQRAVMLRDQEGPLANCRNPSAILMSRLRQARQALPPEDHDEAAPRLDGPALAAAVTRGP